MMGWFGKSQPVGVPADTPAPEKKEEPKQEESGGGDGKIGVELEKIKAQLQSQGEMAKVASERFGRVNEQIGELRAMILDRDKSSKMLEAKALQAIDMVESVQPDKLMIENRKMDGKIEALRASLEGNESILKNMMSEMKEFRSQMGLFKGLDEVVKLSNDIKNDLMIMRKISIDVERHADMVSSIFNESQKKFSDTERFVDSTKELEKNFKAIMAEFETIKAKEKTLANQKEYEQLLGKFNSFEKHAGNVMLLLNKKFTVVEDELKAKFDEKIVKVDKLVKGLEIMVRKTPDLDKFFQLLDKSAKEAPPEEKKEEKPATPGEEKEEEKPAEGKEKKA